MTESQSKLTWLLGDTQPNQAQRKFFASIASNLGQAIFLASGAGILVPAKEGAGILLSIVGLSFSTALFVIASRLLKEVKD